MIRVPLYSRSRPLKNLVTDWNDKWSNSNILCDNWDYVVLPPPKHTLSPDEEPLYKAVIKRWWFSTIGFDSDLEFIYRFNAVWESNFDKYFKLLKKVESNGCSYEKEERGNNLVRSGSDTDKATGTVSTVTDKTGEDTMQKGVSTTSSQNTSNEGDKLARATPNEQLKVAGKSETTVTDSGEDKNIYGSKVSTVETPDTQNVKEYNSSVSVNESITREKLTPNELDLIYHSKNVLEAFALCFEKLFIGVL